MRGGRGKRPPAKRRRAMECTVPGCGGVCAPATINQFYPGKRGVTVSGVPAEVCAVCGTEYLAPATEQRLRDMLRWAQGIKCSKIIYHEKATSATERRRAAVKERDEPRHLPPARHKR